MMEHGDLVTLTKDISYRPEWEFSVYLWQLSEDLPQRGFEQGDTVPCLKILASVLDSWTLEPNKVQIARVIPRGARQNPAMFLDWVKALLIELEYHELREFFRYQGELVDDPHVPIPAKESDT